MEQSGLIHLKHSWNKYFQLKYCLWKSRRVARGWAMGAIDPPIPKVELNILRLIKLLMCKTKNTSVRTNETF